MADRDLPGPPNDQGLLVAGGPLGVLLEYQALEPLRQLAVLIPTNIRSGLGQIQVALVFQRLGGGAVGDPVLLELEQMLGALQHDDHAARPPITQTGLPTPATTGSVAATASSSSLSHL
jgi:hypothetical protein